MLPVSNTLQEDPDMTRVCCDVTTTFDLKQRNAVRLFQTLVGTPCLTKVGTVPQEPAIFISDAAVTNRAALSAGIAAVAASRTTTTLAKARSSGNARQPTSQEPPAPKVRRVTCL